MNRELVMVSRRSREYPPHCLCNTHLDTQELERGTQHLAAMFELLLIAGSGNQALPSALPTLFS